MAPKETDEATAAPPRRRGRLLVRLLVIVLIGLPLLALGGTTWYSARGSALCGDCHEIQPQVELWQASTHRSIGCDACHGGLLTPDLDFHLGNLQRLVTHSRGTLPGRIRIRDQHVDALVERCAACHRQEFAEWESGPHGTPYGRIFRDPHHNEERKLMDDCLRCHGMFFEGGIRDLVTPVDTEGPWELKPEGFDERHAIPCMACHKIHREGRPQDLIPPPGEEEVEPERHRPSLALFDRRGQSSIGVERLPFPPIQVEGTPVKVANDPRQALCHQCHAALAGAEAGSGDDRTPIGVHEGISCRACHGGHSENAAPSCAGCHPKMSNCGLDVAAMDTTFRDPESPHDIHRVSCTDCHPGGVPPANDTATVDWVIGRGSRPQGRLAPRKEG